MQRPVLPPYGQAHLRSISNSPATPRPVHRWWVWSRATRRATRDAERWPHHGRRRPRQTGRVPRSDGSCSPIQLLSVGPFPRIEAGDSLVVDFARVGGRPRKVERSRRLYASFAASIDYHLPSRRPRRACTSIRGRPRDALVGRLARERDRSDESRARGARLRGLPRTSGSTAPRRACCRSTTCRTTGYNTGLARILAPQPAPRRRRDLPLQAGHPESQERLPLLRRDHELRHRRCRNAAAESGLGQNKFAVIPNAARGARWRHGVSQPTAWTRRGCGRFGAKALRVVCRTSFAMHDPFVHAVGRSRVRERVRRRQLSQARARRVQRSRREIATSRCPRSPEGFAPGLDHRPWTSRASGPVRLVRRDRDTGVLSRGKLLLVKSDRGVVGERPQIMTRKHKRTA